jgi:hypothetical protein
MSKQVQAVRLGNSTCLIFVITASLVTSCSRNLSHDEAKAIIERNSLIRATDKVSVDAISASESAEAIVRATIAGRTTNLKFRNFDNGWTWEFVETKAGGWIAPDVAIGQIREEVRTAAAAAWAEQNTATYAATAKTISILALYNALNPSEVEHLDLVMKLRRSMLESFKSRPEMQERLAVLTNDHPTDAWGNEIETRFDSKTGATLIRSLGRDKTPGTEDDLLCLNTFKRGSEDGRLVWEREKTWTLPEGLGAVVQSLVDKTADRVEYTKVVKP